MVLTLTPAAGCGKSDEEAAGKTPLTDTDSSESEQRAVEFTAVELPADFPPDFPVAPVSTVVSATSTADAGGAYSEISMACPGESSDVYQWYRQALADAGWRVSSEGQTDETRTLHATQGESYIDLTVMPHPEATPGWVRVSASIWRAGI